MFHPTRYIYRRKKGGSAFIPGLKTGDFPLRPLYPRKLKALNKILPFPLSRINLS
jgi:hypothetical protein